MLVKFDHFPNFRGEKNKYLKPPPSLSLFFLNVHLFKVAFKLNTSQQKTENKFEYPRINLLKHTKANSSPLKAMVGKGLGRGSFVLVGRRLVVSNELLDLQGG